MPDPSPGFEAAWERFQAAQSLRLVPRTIESEWALGRGRYIAFLVPITDAAAQAYLRHFAERCAAIPGVEPYPPQYWHITIKGAGFEVPERRRDDELSWQDVEGLAIDAQPLFDRYPRFDVQLGLLNAFEEVVYVEVWDGGQITAMNTHLMERLPTMPRFPVDGPVFLPHVSVARFTSEEHIDQLKRTVAELRRPAPGPTLAIESIHLVRAHLSDAAPAFELLRRYSLQRPVNT